MAKSRDPPSLDRRDIVGSPQHQVDDVERRIADAGGGIDRDEPAFLSANIGEVWVREGEAEVGSFWAADYLDGGEVVVMFDGDPGVVMAAFERLRRYAAGRLLD